MKHQELFRVGGRLVDVMLVAHQYPRIVARVSIERARQSAPVPGIFAWARPVTRTTIQSKMIVPYLAYTRRLLLTPRLSLNGSLITPLVKLWRVTANRRVVRYI